MQVINLDLSVKGDIPLLHAKQGDVGRCFQVVLTDSGLAYKIPNDANLSVWYSGDSGDGNYSEIGLDDDFLRSRSAFTISGNTVTVEMVAQMLSCPGGGAVSLVINGAEGDQIAMWNIPYCVEELPGANSEEAKQYYTAYAQAAMREMSSALAAALEDAKQSGEFDGPRGIQGEKGDTPVKGVDYWTDADKQEIMDDVLDAIPDAGGSGELRYCADCHTVTEGGSYYIDANTLNRPDDVSAGALLVERTRTSSGIDTNLTLNDSGSIIRCSYSSLAGAWSEWEYENPPYQGNKVYRTTERFRGHPVYAVNIACGMAVHGGTQVTLSAGIVGDPEFEACHNEWTVISYDGSMCDGFYHGVDGNDVIKTGDYPIWSAFSSIKAMWSANGLTLNFSYKDSSFASTMEGDTYITVKFIKKEAY